jgi:LPS-assembly lipoprotein
MAHRGDETVVGTTTSGSIPAARRRVVLGFGAVLGLSGLAACGFSPVYAPGSAAEGLLGQVQADEPDTAEGFAFVGQIEERLGRSSAPKYRLEYQIQTRSVGVGITPAAETTRFNLFGGVSFRLVDAASGRVEAKGFEENFTGYSATRFTVSTRTVEREASVRLMKILADQVVTRLATNAGDLPR